MSRRYKMSRRSSKRYFSKAANLSHRKNQLTNTGPMRGGIRL